MGGFGVVWEAKNNLDGVRYAIKNINCAAWGQVEFIKVCRLVLIGQGLIYRSSVKSNLMQECHIHTSFVITVPGSKNRLPLNRQQTGLTFPRTLLSVLATRPFRLYSRSWASTRKNLDLLYISRISSARSLYLSKWSSVNSHLIHGSKDEIDSITRINAPRIYCPSKRGPSSFKSLMGFRISMARIVFIVISSHQISSGRQKTMNLVLKTFWRRIFWNWLRFKQEVGRLVTLDWYFPLFRTLLLDNLGKGECRRVR